MVCSWPNHPSAETNHPPPALQSRRAFLDGIQEHHVIAPPSVREKGELADQPQRAAAAQRNCLFRTCQRGVLRLSPRKRASWRNVSRRDLQSPGRFLTNVPAPATSRPVHPDDPDTRSTRDQPAHPRTYTCPGCRSPGNGPPDDRSSRPGVRRHPRPRHRWPEIFLPDQRRHPLLPCRRIRRDGSRRRQPLLARRPRSRRHHRRQRHAHRSSWGQAANTQTVLERLADIAGLRGILLTHNETSTGVTNNVQALASAIRAQYPDVLIAVDAVSSLSCIDLRMDEWDLDVVFTGSQKGWMVPPGLAMIAVSPRAWKANQQARLPRMYWDFAWAKRSLDKGQTPYTPPVSIFFGLDASLEMMRAEGREAIFARHQAIGELTRRRARELGLELLAYPAFASNTVTAIKIPQGIEVKALRKALREQDHVVIAGGQEQLEGKIVRVGHLGYVHQPEINAAMEALERQLVALGYQLPSPARQR